MILLMREEISHRKELYRVLTRIAGDNGACWMNRGNLAELCNMSDGSITNAKKELLQNFNELDGKKLIILEECKKAKIEQGIKKNTTIYHKVMIADIWRYNRAYMATRKYMNEDEAPSSHDSASQAPSSHDSVQQGALSPHDTKNNTVKENQLLKEQQPVDLSTPVCSLDLEEVVLSIPNLSEEMDLKTKAFNWFMKIGCDERNALHFTNNFSCEDITNASIYVEKQIAKKKQKNEYIPNIIGYLRKTLENKYWVKK